MNRMHPLHAATHALAAPSAQRSTRYALPVPRDDRRLLAAAWLGLGVAALLAAGLFSLLLVLARTPVIGPRLPFADAFRTALVVHVDLSVLVWFGAFAAMLWTLDSPRRWRTPGWIAIGLGAVGATFMAAAPFVDAGTPIMANYIPVLESPTFLTGLALFGAAFTLAATGGVAGIGHRSPHHDQGLDGAAVLRFGLAAAAGSALIAAGAFTWSWLEIPADLSGKAYYELLFWGGGHVLQFTWTILMLAAWLWLACRIGARLPLSPRVAALLFAVAFAAVLVAPAIYVRWPVGAPEHTRMFTWLMRAGGGLAILPLALAVTIGLARVQLPRLGRVAPDRRPLLAALAASMTLFAAGGVIGFMIQGSDVRVPAHYHGSIVGVTLAFMGLAYALLPALGFRAPSGRLAAWQPVVYGGGQLLHIVGLVWSGGHGVARKVAGTEQVLRTTSETLGMGLMGIGGLVAIAGGLMFLIAMLGAIRPLAPSAPRLLTGGER